MWWDTFLHLGLGMNIYIFSPFSPSGSIRMSQYIYRNDQNELNKNYEQLQNFTRVDTQFTRALIQYCFMQHCCGPS